MQEQQQPAKKTPITKEQFESVLELLSTTPNNINKCCELANVNVHNFYRYLNSEGEQVQQSYVRARELYVEVRLTERDRLNKECLEKMHASDPKMANAIASHYREMIRQIEWDVQKLLPKKYGDKLDITGDHKFEVKITTAESQGK